MDPTSESNVNEENSPEMPEAESSANDPVSSEDAAKQKRVDELLSRPIPPRRNRGTSAMPRAMHQPPRPAQPAPVQPTPTQPAAESPITMPFATKPSQPASPAASREAHSDTAGTAELYEELSQLRLQLEASQQELMHVSAARDQALSVVEQSENRVGRLEQQLKHHAAESESQLANFKQQLRQREEEAFAKNSELASQKNKLAQELAELHKAVDELKQNSVDLETALADAKAEAASAKQSAEESSTDSGQAVRELEAKHLQTIDELRTVLGQREAAEASLARERDALSEQVADLQRKLDAQPQDAPEDGNGTSSSAEAQALNQRIEELEQRGHQVSSELSLANETIRQLNQNLSQRDAKFMRLQQEHSVSQQELETLRKAEQDSSSAAELEKLGEDLDATKRDLEVVRGELAAALDRATSGDALHAEQETLIKKREAELQEREQLIASLRTELEAIKKKQSQTSITPDVN